MPGGNGSNLRSAPRPGADVDVLVVDDDGAVRSTCAEILRRAGYTVAVADDGDVALRLLDEMVVAMVLLDLRMPLVDGLGFLRRLRAHDDQRATPVAIVTGDYFLEDAVSNELQQLGAELRFKPLWLEDLVRLARNLLKVTH